MASIKFFLLLFMGWPFFLITVDASVKEIKEIEAVYYSPVDDKLRDLICDIKILNLEDFIKHQLKLSDTEDVHFRVYWSYPDTYRVEVNGLPDGFEQLKNKLKQQLIPLLGYVIPKKISELFQTYEKKVIKDKETITIIGNDKTGYNEVNEIKMTFDKDKKLQEQKTFGLGGMYTSYFKIGKKPWSHNKWVIESMRMENKKGIFITSTTHKIKYKTYHSFGFPYEIIIETRLESGKKKTVHGQHRSTIVLKNYVINSGQAKKYIKAIKK